jgi:hypothetical protein
MGGGVDPDLACAEAGAGTMGGGVDPDLACAEADGGVDPFLDGDLDPFLLDGGGVATEGMPPAAGGVVPLEATTVPIF